MKTKGMQATFSLPGDLVSVSGTQWKPSEISQVADETGLVVCYSRYVFQHASGTRFSWEVYAETDPTTDFFGHVDFAVYIETAPRTRIAEASFSLEEEEFDEYNEFVTSLLDKLAYLWLNSGADSPQKMLYRAIDSPPTMIQKPLGLQLVEPVTLTNLGYNGVYYAVNYDAARPLTAQSIYELDTLKSVLSAPPHPVHGYRDPKTRAAIANIRCIQFTMPSTAGIKRRMSLGGGKRVGRKRNTKAKK